MGLEPWKIDNDKEMLFFYSKKPPELHFKHSGLDISKITAEFTFHPPKKEELEEGFKNLKNSVNNEELKSVDVTKGQISSDLLTNPLEARHLHIPIQMPQGERHWNAFNFQRFDSPQFAVAVIPVLPQNITQ